MIQSWLIYFLLLIGAEALADILAKEFSIKGGLIFASLAITGYIIGNIFWLFALKNGAGLARGSILFSVLSGLIAVLFGLLLYKEPVSKLQLIGIVFGLVSVGLLSIGE